MAEQVGPLGRRPQVHYRFDKANHGIGPEGGAAPLSIDGKDVLYDFRMFKGSTETLVAEWIAEGKIYNDRDIIIEHQTEDHTRDDPTDEAN